MTANERLKIIREDKGLTLEKFGERVGVTKVAISNIEKGNRALTSQMFKSICREYRVREEWLRDGTGDMYVSTIPGTIESLRSEYDLDDFSVKFVEKYLELSPEDRELVRDFFYSVVAPEDLSEDERRDQLHRELDRQLDLEKKRISEVS